MCAYAKDFTLHVGLNTVLVIQSTGLIEFFFVIDLQGFGCDLDLDNLTQNRSRDCSIKNCVNNEHEKAEWSLGGIKMTTSPSFFKLEITNNDTCRWTWICRKDVLRCNNSSQYWYEAKLLSSESEYCTPRGSKGKVGKCRLRTVTQHVHYRRSSDMACDSWKTTLITAIYKLPISAECTGKWKN